MGEGSEAKKSISEGSFPDPMASSREMSTFSMPTSSSHSSMSMPPDRYLSMNRSSLDSFMALISEMEGSAATSSDGSGPFLGMRSIPGMASLSTASSYIMARGASSPSEATFLSSSIWDESSSILARLIPASSVISDILDLREAISEDCLSRDSWRNLLSSSEASSSEVL